MVEITSEQNKEQNKVKRMKRTEDSLRDLWNNIKCTNIQIIGVPEEEKRKGYEITFEDIHSVQFSCSVMSDSLRPHEPWHARPPCPSPTPRVQPNSCPLSWWCHPTISSSGIPFSSRPQSFTASGSFQMSQLFISSGQSIGVSASASVLPMNTQDWSPLRWTGFISLQSKGLLRVFSNTTVQKHQFFDHLSLLYSPTFTSIHDYWKNHCFD